MQRIHYNFNCFPLYVTVLPYGLSLESLDLETGGQMSANQKLWEINSSSQNYLHYSSRHLCTCTHINNPLRHTVSFQICAHEFNLYFTVRVGLLAEPDPTAEFHKSGIIFWALPAWCFFLPIWLELNACAPRSPGKLFRESTQCRRQLEELRESWSVEEIRGISEGRWGKSLGREHKNSCSSLGGKTKKLLIYD